MFCMDEYRALLLTAADAAPSVERLAGGDLPDGNVTVRVAFSDLNYKDALALNGKARVVRTYPMIPGIDLAGEVMESAAERYRAGDGVVVTGFGLGETRWGGYAQLTRVPDDFLVTLPGGLSPRDAMAIGTAGLTAMLAVLALEEHGVRPDDGEVVVTGAVGGVGSMAVALLARLGYEVTASTGRLEEEEYLRRLGAHTVAGRDLFAHPERPLRSERFAGAIDAVGGETLAALLSMMRRQGAVAATGNAGGNSLPTTVLPFILRGVDLLGIDSNFAPLDRRRLAWARLAGLVTDQVLAEVARIVPLTAVPDLSREMLQGRVRGRTVVDVNA